MNDMSEPRTSGLFIPFQSLSEETLQRVVESFVLREGTDYGEQEHSLEAKVQHVLQQLRRSQAHIVFNPSDHSIDIVPGAAPT